MSPVIRQKTNEQDRKVATKTPCCAGGNLCAARLQTQHWVSLLQLASFSQCQMLFSYDGQTVR